MLMLVMMAIAISDLINKPKPGSNASNNKAILVFLFLTSSFFQFANKTKT